MIIGFVVWSIVAVILLGIGISCRKSEEAVGFFTFVKPPVVNDVERYNHALSILWMVAAGIFEVIGIPFLFLEQNSSLFVPVIFAVIIWVIAMMIVYGRIEGKYKG